MLRRPQRSTVGNAEVLRETLDRTGEGAWVQARAAVQDHDNGEQGSLRSKSNGVMWSCHSHRRLEVVSSSLSRPVTQQLE